MRTTVTVDDELWNEAVRVTAVTRKRTLIERGLQALIDQAARRRATALAGSMPDLDDIPRRKMSRARS